MQREKLEELITALVLPIIEGTDLDLVDIEYVREKDWYLRVYIDKPGGIEIDDCQYVSEKLTKLLDEKDPIKDKYYLEVSSPGIDRPLKKDKDFVRMYGKKVDLLFFTPWNGAKTIEAVLVAHDTDNITLLLNDNSVVIERKLIASIRPHIDF
ncbi:MAG: ribosome maturation factor RimP [Acidaminococcaceae bacterium]